MTMRITPIAYRMTLFAFCEWRVKPKWYSKDKIHGDHCAFKSKVEVGGRWFCKRHGKMFAAGRTDKEGKPYRPGHKGISRRRRR